MSLTDFLLARIAEDEDAARRVGTVRQPLDQASYFRVLAECDAKRRIVGLHHEILTICQGCANESYPCRTLRALALPYADHPDYREEWRP